MRIDLYSQNAHTIIIDGNVIDTFGEGDYMQIKLDGGGASRTHGGDGPALNQTVAQGGQITLGLLPTSPALGTLYALRELQIKNPRSFSIVLMTGVKETIYADKCAFGELPQFASGGPAMKDRQFVFECLDIELDTSDIEPV